MTSFTPPLAKFYFATVRGLAKIATNCTWQLNAWLQELYFLADLRSAFRSVAISQRFYPYDVAKSNFIGNIVRVRTLRYLTKIVTLRKANRKSARK